MVLQQHRAVWTPTVTVIIVCFRRIAAQSIGYGNMERSSKEDPQATPLWFCIWKSVLSQNL